MNTKEARQKDEVRLEGAKLLALQASLLFLLNVVAMGCGAFALFCGLLTGNNVAAAFPALLALLLSLWQPWLLFLCLIPYGAALAPFVSVPITIVVYRILARRGMLDGLKQVVRQKPRLLAAWLGGGLLVGALVSFEGYKDVIPQNRGIPRTISGRLPQAARDVALQDSRYYVLDNFIDTAFLWRVQVAPSDASVLLERLDIRPVKTGTLPEGFWKQAPVWWQRPPGSLDEYTTGVFSTEKGEGEGWHAGAVYDAHSQMLYVWGKDNF